MRATILRFPAVSSRRQEGGGGRQESGDRRQETPAVLYRVSQALPFLVAIAAAVVAAIAGAPAVYAALGFVLLVAVLCASTHCQITTQRIKLERGLLNELHKPLGMRLVGQGALHLFSSDAKLETSRTGEDRKE
jgi:hypothetical protein